MAISKANIRCELREVVLKDKPKQMLAISDKATVPVLSISDDEVLEQSLDIMKWALNQSDPDDWLSQLDNEEANTLLEQNDNEFKYYLDRYKYYVGYPEHSQQYYRDQAELFLQGLESMLSQHEGFALLGSKLGFTDIAIFPFIRQFANVEPDWFFSTSYQHLIDWYHRLHESELFTGCMKKYSQWNATMSPVYFPN